MSSAEDAKSEAASKNKPYALFFCSEEVAKFAGEGSLAVESYRKANNNKPPVLTPFDQSTVMAEMGKAGVQIYAKVTATKANEALYRKYSAGLNTLIICAPNGDSLLVLSGQQCNQSGVSSAMKNFEAIFTGWKNHQKKTEVAKASK